MGYGGLRSFQSQHYLTNAKFSSAQKFENLKAGRIRYGLKDLYLGS